MARQTDPTVDELAATTREFIDEEVIPVERELLESQEAVSPSQLDSLRETAREYGVYGPGFPEKYGGLGLTFRERVPLVEESGRSMIGKAVTMSDILDEVRVKYLLEAGTEEQQDRWLQQIIDGDLITAISLTEPMQGAGADPTYIKTTADRDGDEWVINGHKTWVTRGSESDLMFLYADADPGGHPHDSLTCFAVPTDTDGVEIVRDVPHMGGGVLAEVHSEIKLHDVRVPDENVMGEVGDGFELFQICIDQARIWHGLHKAGMAERSLEIAKAYMEERELFGESISEKQAPRFDIAKAETNLHVWKTFNRDVAEKVTAGDDHRVEAAMHMYYCANVAQEIIDTALQVLGSNGMSKDVPVSNFYETVRGFRIYDGPDEVHLRTIARDAFDDVETWHADPITRYNDE